MPFIYAPYSKTSWRAAGGVESRDLTAAKLTKLGELIFCFLLAGSLTITTTGDSTTGDWTGHIKPRRVSGIYDLIFRTAVTEIYFFCTRRGRVRSE